MGTTDTLLAQRLLRVLDAHNVEYLVLHNAPDIANGKPISDVDTIVRCKPWRVVAQLLDEESRHGLSLVMTWEYDFGALTSFWMSADGSDGVQLDLLEDADGRGRYGFRTERAFSFADTSEWPPRLSRPAMLVYLLSKRIAKGDLDRADGVARELNDLGRPYHLELLSPRCRWLSARAINGHFPTSRYRHFVKWRSRASLLGIRRLARPTGITVSVPAADEKALMHICNRFSAVLARVSLVADQRAGEALRRWWLTRGPVLIIRSIRAPASSSALSIQELSASIVRAMEETTRARGKSYYFGKLWLDHSL
jgi:hypothetical protein